MNGGKWNDGKISANKSFLTYTAIPVETYYQYLLIILSF